MIGNERANSETYKSKILARLNLPLKSYQIQTESTLDGS